MLQHVAFQKYTNRISSYIYFPTKFVVKIKEVAWGWGGGGEG